MSTLKLCEEVDIVIFKNPCMYEYEDVKINTIHALGYIAPYCNFFLNYTYTVRY